MEKLREKLNFIRAVRTAKLLSCRVLALRIRNLIRVPVSPNSCINNKSIASGSLNSVTARIIFNPTYLFGGNLGSTCPRFEIPGSSKFTANAHIPNLVQPYDYNYFFLESGLQFSPETRFRHSVTVDKNTNQRFFLGFLRFTRALHQPVILYRWTRNPRTFFTSLIRKNRLPSHDSAQNLTSVAIEQQKKIRWSSLWPRENCFLCIR